MGLVHELGEGVVKLPRGYRYLTRHTIMRGVGKDVRNALDLLGAESVASVNNAGELIKMLDVVMKAHDFIMSDNRSRDSPITKSEKDLIRWNWDNGKRGKEVLFGIQDFLSPEENARFTQDIRNLTNDLRQGVLNIFLMRSKIESIAPQTAIGKEAERKIREKIGVNTQMLYFEDSKALKAKLEKALETVMSAENKGKYPKIFVDCLTPEDVATVQGFITDQALAGNKGLDKIIAIGKDFVDNAEVRDLPDEVKVILVGSVIMNDRRLREDFSMSPNDLLASRRHIIDFLKNNNIIEDKMVVDSEIDSFFDELWRGIRRLMITRINWKELQDFKSGQDAVMRSL